MEMWIIQMIEMCIRDRGNNYLYDFKIVDVNIRRIRNKIEDDPSKPKYIQTIWGYGYCFRKED